MMYRNHSYSSLNLYALHFAQYWYHEHLAYLHSAENGMPSHGSCGKDDEILSQAPVLAQCNNPDLIAEVRMVSSGKLLCSWNNLSPLRK